MTTLAIITALVIFGALCALVGYAVGMTRGERDGARRERIVVEVLRNRPGEWYCETRPVAPAPADTREPRA